MKPSSRFAVSCVQLSGLAACGCVDEYVDTLPSPDGTLKAAPRHCGYSITTYRRTQVTVLELSRKADAVRRGGSGEAEGGAGVWGRALNIAGVSRGSSFKRSCTLPPVLRSSLPWGTISVGPVIRRLVSRTQRP
jgi:hypothetical protein